MGEAPSLDPLVILERVRRDLERLEKAYTAFEIAEDCYPVGSPLTERRRGELTTMVLAMTWHRSQIDAILGAEGRRT